MDIKKIIKKTIKGITLSIAILLFLIGGLYIMVQTELGKTYMKRSIQYLLSSDTERQVRISTINGHIPFDIRIESLAVSDEKGPWLVIKNISLVWKPFRLIKGEIYVNELRAEEILLSSFSRPVISVDVNAIKIHQSRASIDETTYHRDSFVTAIIPHRQLQSCLVTTR